ncbi:MAG: prolipoprotein diacylglyceryl transferase [Nitrospirota bacterium]
MIAYPHIDPEIFRIGQFSIRWYGLMYAVGFAASYLLVRYQLKKNQDPDFRNHIQKLPPTFLDSLYTYLILGLVIGARVGYILFYDLSNYLNHPLEVFAVWHGGMSFHGGLIGTLFGGYWCCKKYRADFWRMADLVIVTAPIGLACGRLGNFINGELYGRITDVPWAMVFPSGGPFPRHPSQLYEFALEGVFLFIILWSLKNRKLAAGSLSALFLVLYGVFRFFVEFFREPDAHIGFIAGFLTMGQLLCILTAFVGILLLFIRQRR